MTLSFRVRALLLTLVTVFIAEAVVMLLLPLLHLPPGSVVEGLIDATILTAVILPFLLRVETKRARAEARVAQLAAIVEHAEDAIVRTTLDGVITSWNKGAERLTGYQAEEVIGRRPTMLFPPDREGEAAQLIERLRRGERVSQFETVNVRKDGTHHDVSISLAAILDHNGRPVGTSAVVRDVTERKRLIRELEQALAQVKTLSGLVPICANCKKVRDDSGYWHNVEQYVQERTEAEFSHGICPDCARKLYGEYLDDPAA